MADTSFPIDPRCRQHETDAWDTVAIMYVQPMLSVFGILGDLSMLVTIRYGHLNDSPYVYLRCIALGDLILLLLVLTLLVAQCATCQFSIQTVYYLEVYFWFVYMTISNLMRSWLVLLTLFMTIERFVYVRWPVETRHLCTRERAKKVCVALFVVACASQLLRPLQFWVEIGPREFFETKTSIETAGNFHCVANTNETFSANRFLCHTDVDRSGSIGSNCEDSKDAQSNSSPDTGECRHKLCELPQLPRSLTFDLHEKVDDSWVILKTSHMNVTVMVLTNNSSGLPTEDIYGSAHFINGTCHFVTAPKSLNGTVNELNDFFLEPYKESVQCVVSRAFTEPAWRSEILLVYLGTWEAIFIACTGVLTVFNVLIVFVVRRANQKARKEVLSNSEQDATSKRQAEENRLTMSLLALSCVKIITDLMYISCETFVAELYYNEISPPGFRLKVHRIIAAQVHIFEYSSYFYLLAFINRKFKREFFRQLVSGKLAIKSIPDNVLKMFTISSRTASTSSVGVIILLVSVSMIECRSLQLSASNVLRHFVERSQALKNSGDGSSG